MKQYKHNQKAVFVWIIVLVSFQCANAFKSERKWSLLGREAAQNLKAITAMIL